MRYGLVVGGLLIAVLIASLPLLVTPELPWVGQGRSNEFGSVLARSLAFSVVTAFLTVALASTIAITLGLKKIGVSRAATCVLLIPFLLGDASSAYLAKLMLGGASGMGRAFGGGWLGPLSATACLHVWQLGLLFGYVGWLTITGAGDRDVEWTVVSRWSLREQWRLIGLQRIRQVLLLTLVVSFVSAMGESLKIHYVFQGSAGTGTELISGWFRRVYFASAVIDPGGALGTVLWFTRNTVVIGIGGLLLTATLLSLYLAWAVRLKGLLRGADIHYRFVEGARRFLVFSLAAIALCPIALGAVRSGMHRFEWPVELQVAVGHATGAAAAATLVAIGISVAVRCFLRDMGGELGPRMLMLLSLPFTISLPPPTGLYVIIRWFMEGSGVSALAGGVPLWYLGHGILVFPVLFGFITIVHFQVEPRELEYVALIGANPVHQWHLLFLLRFWPQYLLTWIAAAVLIINEGTWNRLFARVVPSYVGSMEMALSGRSADLVQANGFLVLALFGSSAAIVIWSLILKKDSDQERG